MVKEILPCMKVTKICWLLIWLWVKFISEYITWIHVEEGRRCFGEDDKVCVCNERERERRHRWNDFSGITVWLVEQRGGNCILITVLMVLCSARWKLLYRYAQNKSAFFSNPPLAPLWHYSFSIYCLASLHVSLFTSLTYLSSFLQQRLLNYSFFFFLLFSIYSLFSIFSPPVSLPLFCLQHTFMKPLLKPILHSKTNHTDNSGINAFGSVYETVFVHSSCSDKERKCVLLLFWIAFTLWAYL